MNKLTLAFLLSFSGVTMGLTVSWTNSPPKIDGKLDDTVWKTAEVSVLKPDSKKQSIKNRTTVQLGYDSENLYLAFVCHESRMDLLKTAWDHFEERDSAIWNDDCVEILLDPFNSEFDYYQILVNSAGVVADCRTDDWLWNTKLRQGIQKMADRWTVELAIPFADLGYVPVGGEIWRGNLCREEKPAKELSAVYPSEGCFAIPARFGSLSFQAKHQAVKFSLTKHHSGCLEGILTNSSANVFKGNVIVRCLEDRDVAAKVMHAVEIASAGQTAVVLNFKPTAKTSSIDIEVTDAAGTKSIYHNRFMHTAATNKPQLRVWQVDRPLYKELFSDQPLNMIQKGALFWTHGMYYTNTRLMASQYGISYRYEDFLKAIGENNLSPMLEGPSFIGSYYNARYYFPKYGIKGILLADARGGPTPEIDNGPFMPDPKAVEYYIKRTLKELQECKDLIWAVCYGDELFEYNETRGIEFFATMKDKYPYIVEADREIKEKYGSGKYGIPLSKDDNNPYRWIAYRRWMNDKMIDIFNTLYKRIKADYPNLVVVSPDPIAFHRPYDFSRWKPFSDILTHQLYPRRTSTRADFGFITKLIRDISGIEEVWPCLHVENYAASFTPQEVVEMVSQAFRNGATGFHYYLDDTIGRYAKKKYLYSEYFGAPDRWQIEMALLAEGRKMNKLKFPKADFAILYSCDSYSGQLPDQIADEAEVAYTLCGPVAGSWFKFIDDNQIERGTVRLADYRVIYIPYATYQRESVIAKLADYVQNGGVLVCGDPEAFSYDTVGKDVSSWRKKLFGTKTIGYVKLNNLLYKQTKLPVFAKAVKVSLGSDTTILGRFENNDPAIVSHTFGKGRTIYFCANPFKIQALANEGWKSLFKGMQVDFDLAVNQDIWRFRFPESLIKPLTPPTGRCLTNNQIFWKSFEPLGFCNIDTKGTYRYDIAPDGIRDQGEATDISFVDGHLTNRRKALLGGNVHLGDSKLEDWIIRFDRPDPTAITFDFKREYPVEKVVLFYTGQLPEVSVEVSKDGRTWQSLATSAAPSATADIIALTLSGRATAAQYVRVNFGQRPPKASFTLVETEVWAK